MYRFSAVFAVLLVVCSQSYCQHILFQSNLENIPLTMPDSLPAGWKKLDVDQNNPVLGWAINDTNQHFGGDTTVFHPRAHSGKKCLFIFWLAGLGNTNLNDDWVWTDSLRIQNGDSLIFWCLLGSVPPIAPYPDSVQIHVCTSQNPNSSILKLATIKSNDSSGYPLNNNTWREYKYNLSQYAGQRIYIAWRYYMVISANSGLWINIDDITIGRRSPIGITKISENIPTGFSLEQNFPNPFNPQTKIVFDIPQAYNSEKEPVRLVIFDVLGREVAKPVDGTLPAGTYQYSFNASQLSSGIYYYRLTCGNFAETKKMVLSK